MLGFKRPKKTRSKYTYLYTTGCREKSLSSPLTTTQFYVPTSLECVFFIASEPANPSAVRPGECRSCTFRPLPPHDGSIFQLLPPLLHLFYQPTPVVQQFFYSCGEPWG